MSPQNDHSEIFGAELLAERVIEEVTFRIYTNRIFYVKIPRMKKIDMRIVEHGYDFLNEHGGGKFLNIYAFDSFADVEPEVREWAADSTGNHYTISDAIVIGGLSQKIIADFYVRVNKPIKPTRIFYSLRKAIEWTHDQMKEHS